jgi:hypothetical protein
MPFLNSAKREPLDQTALREVAPLIRRELHAHFNSSPISPAEALKRVFAELFGMDRDREDFLRFLCFAAPLARRLAIRGAPTDTRLGLAEATVADLIEWFGWLDIFDPLCARMIDLHYIAGLTPKETAAVLKMPPQAVIRDLRFAKAWLAAKLL